MGLATRSFTSTTMEGDCSRKVDGREKTAKEEMAAKKAEASEQADGGSQRLKKKGSAESSPASAAEEANGAGEER